MQVVDVNRSNKGTRSGGIGRFSTMVVVGNYKVGQRERETLHLFQPPRADQMPDPSWGQCHDIRPTPLHLRLTQAQ